MLAMVLTSVVAAVASELLGVYVVGELHLAPLLHEHVDLYLGVLLLAVLLPAFKLFLHGDLLHGVLHVDGVQVDVPGGLKMVAGLVSDFLST